MVIARVKHINFQKEKTGDSYYFKCTNDEIRPGDLVECDTKYGVVLAEVRSVIKNINDIFNDPHFVMPTKECRIYGAPVQKTYEKPEEEYVGFKHKEFAIKLDKDLDEIDHMESEGLTLIWSENEDWCKIGGKIFNVRKCVYEYRKYLKEHDILLD